MTAHRPECSRAATGIPVDKFCDCDLIARVEKRVRDEDVAAVDGLDKYVHGQINAQDAIAAIDALRGG